MTYPPMPGQPPAAPQPQQPVPSPAAQGSSFSFADLITAAEQAGFFVFPDGTYDVVVHSAEATKASTGKHMIKVQYSVATGPYAGSSARIRDQFVLSPDNGQALGFFFRKMEAHGLPKAYFAQFAGTGIENALPHVAAALTGRAVRVEVGQREYNGQQQNEVKNYLSGLYRTAVRRSAAVRSGRPAGRYRSALPASAVCLRSAAAAAVRSADHRQPRSSAAAGSRSGAWPQAPPMAPQAPPMAPPQYAPRQVPLRQQQAPAPQAPQYAPPPAPPQQQAPAPQAPQYAPPQAPPQTPPQAPAAPPQQQAAPPQAPQQQYPQPSDPPPLPPGF